jgi:hypothetical protein
MMMMMMMMVVSYCCNCAAVLAVAEVLLWLPACTASHP